MSIQAAQRKYSFHEILRVFFLRDSTELGMVVLFGLFSGLGSLIVPVAVQTFVNTLGFGLLLQPILILAAIVFFVLSFSGILNILEIYVMELLQQRWFSGIALELAHRLTKIHPDALRKVHGTDLSTYFLDIVTVQKTLSVLMLDAVEVALKILFGMILLALYHPYFIVFDIVIVAFIAVVFFGLKDSAVESSLYESKAKYTTTSWLAELARNSFIFRTGESRKFAMSRVDELASEYVSYRKMHFRILLKQIGGSIVLQILMSALLLGAGGWLVIERQLTLGQLVAAELVFSTVVAGISKFGKYLESYYDLRAAIDKIGVVLELPEEPEGSEKLEAEVVGQPLIRVKDLSYVSDFGRVVFSGLTFDVHRGTLTSVLGNNGTGKSALAEFLYGARTPTSGTIAACGLDLRYSSREDLRAYFTFVRPSELLTGTVLDNIRMHRDGVTLDQVQRVLKGVGLAPFVDSLPDGLMTPITAGRYPLSSGQVNQVLLARALVTRPLVLIIDEVLDQLDPDTCRLVLGFLKTGNSASAVLVTTRNPDLARSFDQVIELDGADSALVVLSGVQTSTDEQGHGGYP
jgi:ABC-type bacteriocin/lantibiotic exporter with double-glycine peptidase domain